MAFLGIIFEAMPIAACFHLHMIRPLIQRFQSSANIQVFRAGQILSAQKIRFGNIDAREFIRRHFHQPPERESLMHHGNPLC